MGNFSRQSGSYMRFEFPSSVHSQLLALVEVAQQKDRWWLVSPVVETKT